MTIHKIDAGIDTGPIYGQVLFPISSKDEVIDVLQRATDFGIDLARSVIKNLTALVPYEQDEKNASYFSKRDFPKLEERQDFTRQKSQQ